MTANDYDSRAARSFLNKGFSRNESGMWSKFVFMSAIEQIRPRTVRIIGAFNLLPGGRHGFLAGALPAQTDMRQSNYILPYDPNRLLDILAIWLGLSSDTALSRSLRLSPGVLQAIRRGRLPVRPTILSAMAECAGKSIEDLMFILGERRRKVRMPCALPPR